MIVAELFSELAAMIENPIDFVVSVGAGVVALLGLFEGVVTGAADGYARMAEKPAVTLLHLGPGLANGLANLHNAKKASTPMVNNSTAITATPVATPTGREFTVASYNLERFFDTVNDPGIGEPVLTAAAFDKLRDASSEFTVF